MCRDRISSCIRRRIRFPCSSDERNRIYLDGAGVGATDDGAEAAGSEQWLYPMYLTAMCYTISPELREGYFHL